MASSYQPPLAEGFSQKQLLILLAIALVVVIAVGYKLFFARNSIKLLKPTSNASLKANELEFAWECDKTNVSFVIEVFDEGDLIMRQITNEKSYQPDLNQKLAFQANKKYRWQVIPNPDVAQKYDFKSQSSYFLITQVVPKPIEQPVEQPQPEVSPTPQTSDQQDPANQKSDKQQNDKQKVDKQQPEKDNVTTTPSTNVRKTRDF